MVINPNFWKGRKILLTGHTGFKGSWLSLWLQKLGVDLIGFSSSIPTKPSLFELAKVQDGMTSLMGDIRDYNKLENVLQEYKPEIIIHMAAQSLVHQSYKDPIETYTTNVIGTVNLLEAVRKARFEGVIINVTSDKCYENNEWVWGYRENDPMGGYDPYSSSKGCAELVTSSFRNSFFNPKDYKHHRVALASVRAGNVIGGGDWAEDRLIPDIIRGVLENYPIKIRNPNGLRPWQYVLEPLGGYLLLAEKMWSDGGEYMEGWNFGPNYEDVKPVSWIIEKISQKWGGSIKWELASNTQHEANYLKLDCSKAKTKLGWLPKTNLEQALDFTINWYKQYQQKNDLKSFTEDQIKNFSLL